MGMKKTYPKIEVGNVFGFWVVVSYFGRKGSHNSHHWNCKCVCGEERAVGDYWLRSGKSSSCGCNGVFVLPGELYGRGTVIEKAGRNKREQQLWLLRCNCPGRESYAATVSHLKSGDTTSCGCAKRSDNPLKTLIRAIWRDKYSDGDIALEDFENLSQLPCHYCGVVGWCQRRPKDLTIHNQHVIFSYNGLDRMDNSIKQHTLANCVPCCFPCNQAKSHRSYDDFLTLIRKIYHHTASLQGQLK